MDNFKKGSTEEFDQNWKSRKETAYNHWRKGSPRNQIQLAFRSHYQVFSGYLKKDGISSGKCLEVGCGRGSISSFFADDGFDCTLLDYSQSVLDTAKAIFDENRHLAQFVQGDARDLPFDDGEFDFCMSIGLLEHFEDVGTIIHEQVRTLKPGGRFFGYVVPERPDNIQRFFNWVNYILKVIARIFRNKGNVQEKADIFRSDLDSRRYFEAIDHSQIEEWEAFGMYPMPMISHSPEFPFSLLPAPLEWILTVHFRFVLFLRSIFMKKHPWTCKEKNGQAFLITFRKVSS